MKQGVHRVLILGEDQAILGGLKRDLLAVSSTLTALELPLSAERQALELTLTLDAPTAVLLETSDLGRSLPVARWLREKDHNLQIVGFSPQIATEDLLELMRAGIREWLPVPAGAESLLPLLDRIQAQAAAHPPASWNHGQLVCFLPTKPGSGASTVALHAAQESARITGERVLLLDLDLQCGSLGFATKAVGGLTMNEALLHAHQLDAALWARLVARKGELDIIPAGASTESQHVDPAQVRRILGFAVGRYPLVMADLPGNMEGATLLILEQASRIFMVCTTDLASIHLARRKLELCRSLGVYDKVEIVVNRATFHFGLSKRGLIEILGKAPLALLPSNFVPLQIALKDGILLDDETPLVQNLAPVVQSITGVSPPPPPVRKAAAFSVSRALQNLRSVLSSFRGGGQAASVEEVSLERMREAGQQPAAAPLTNPQEVPAAAAESAQPEARPARRGDRRRTTTDRRRKPRPPEPEVSDSPPQPT